MKTTLTRFRHLLGLSVLGCMAHHANANVVTPITYLWTGNGSDNNLYTPENWENNQPPPSTAGNRADDITDTILRFGPNTRTYVEFNDLYAHQLLFDLIDTPFILNGWNGGTVHLGSGGITYNPAATNYEPWSRIEDNIALHASQTWNITDGILEIYGGISDNLGSGNYGDYQVEKTGDGELRLNAYGSSDWSGGLKLSGGKVVINTSYTADLDMLGYGPLTFAGGALELHSDYFSEYYTELSLNNDLISQGVVAIHSDKDLLFSLDSDVFRLDADTTLRFSGGTFTNLRDIEENETAGALSLTIDSNAAIAHYGASFWTGGTLVDRGVFIFGGENNLPETGTILVGEDGYVGIGDSNSTANFIGQIDLVNSTGTIGFDSDPESATGPDTFTDTINLTGANSSLRLGSATQAILGDSTNFATSTEQIIVGSTEPYRFGGGGGSLFIASLLTDGNGPRSVEVHSIPELPLTVWLLNPNNAFTGGVDVDNSALIFGSGALPNFDAVSGPNAVVNGIVGITTTATGYVGTGDHNLGQDFFAYFPTDTPGIIGFDVFPGDQSPTSQTINDLDTSRFTAAAIGSSSSIRDTNGNVIAPGLELTGNLIPNADGTHRFAAYKGGLMAVPGNLTGNRLIIGRPDSIATFGDRYSETYSTVVISGDNDGKLQNGTTLFSGRLIVGQSNQGPVTTALGSGQLYIEPANFTEGEGHGTPTPQLSAADTGIVIPNNIVINTDELSVGGVHNFKLAGNISGPGKLYVGEDSVYGFELTLSGDNTFQGGVYVGNSSNLVVSSDTGLGAGPLSFGNSGGQLYFTSAAPVINGFDYGDGSSNTLHLDHETPMTLTINQASHGWFRGNVYGDEAKISKTGAGTLRFDYANLNTDGVYDGTNHVGLEVNAGTVIFANGTTLHDSSGGNHTTAIVVNAGGTFGLDGNGTMENPVVVNSGGRLAGFGNYTQSISIGNGAILSPGFTAGHGMIGLMQFEHLELNGGGILELSIAPGGNGPNPFMHDRVEIRNNDDTLVLNATPSSPFTIKVGTYATADSTSFGTATGFLEGQTYSWLIFDASQTGIDFNGTLAGLGVLADFDLASFVLDVTNFSSDLSGSLTVSLDETNGVYLNFTPVPEPSTYALMALGLGLVAWSLRRRLKS